MECGMWIKLNQYSIQQICRSQSYKFFSSSFFFFHPGTFWESVLLCALQKDLCHNEFSPLGTSEPGLQVVSNVQQVDGGVAVPKNLRSSRTCLYPLSPLSMAVGLFDRNFDFYHSVSGQLWFVLCILWCLYSILKSLQPACSSIEISVASPKFINFLNIHKIALMGGRLPSHLKIANAKKANFLSHLGYSGC